MAFFSTALPIIMRQEHYSLTDIALLQLIKLPWILKLFWAPIIDDRAREHHTLRRWIIGAEAFYAIVILTMSLLSLQVHFITIVGLMFIALMASATQDIAVDRYAILSLRKKHRGLGNSMQAGGGFVGSLFGMGVLLMLYDTLGWQWILTLMVLLVLVAILPLWLGGNRTKRQVEPPPKIERIHIKDILGFFSLPQAKTLVTLLLLYYTGIMGMMTIAKPLMVDLGYSIDQIALINGIWGSSVAAGASLLGGLLLRKWHSRPLILALFMLIAFGAACYFWLIVGENGCTPIQIYTAIALLWAAYGFASVGIYTFAMDKVRPNLEGTDFTLQVMMAQLSGIIVGGLSGKFVDLFDYQTLFMAEAGLCLCTLLFIIAKRRDF